MIKVIKRRYIAFHLILRKITSKKEIYNSLMRNLSTANNGRRENRPYIKVIQYDQKTGLGIIRCGHKSVNQLLNSIREGGGLPSEWKLKTLGISGSIKTLKRKYLSKDFK